MAQQTIGVGSIANDGTGDPIRTAFTKTNSNFTELYARPTGGSGSGTVNSGTTGTLAYYALSGTALSPLTLGTGLSISGSTLNATGGSGSGTVNTGTTGTLAFYAGSGTAISPLTLGTNLSITGTTLNAAGGGSSNITFGTTITSAGAVPITEGFSVINNASAASYTLANDTVDGHLHTINNYGAGTATVTVSKLQGTTSVALILPSGGAVNLVWHATLATYLYAS